MFYVTEVKRHGGATVKEIRLRLRVNIYINWYKMYLTILNPCAVKFVLITLHRTQVEKLLNNLLVKVSTLT